MYLNASACLKIRGMVIFALSMARVFAQQEREGKIFKDAYLQFSDYFTPDISTYSMDKASGLSAVSQNLRSLVEQGVEVLEERFTTLKQELPTDIDTTNSVVYKTIAKGNTIFYTIAVSFTLGTVLDMLSNFILEEKKIEDIVTDPLTTYLYSFFGFYGVSFALQFYTGLESPFQDCSATDFVQATRDLDFSLEGSENKTATETLIQNKRYRLLLEQNLYCVTSRDGSYQEANLVNMKIQEMMDISELHNKFKTLLATSDFKVSQVNSSQVEALSAAIRDVDASIHAVWSEMENKVTSAYDTAFAVIKNANYFRGIIGTTSLSGLIFGLLRFKEAFPHDKFPPLADIPFALLEDFYTIIQGQASNNFLVGELVALASLTSWGYGFITPFYGNIEEPDVGCGIHQFNDIARSYPEYTNFTIGFGTPEQIISDRNMITLPALPIFTVYRLKQFTRKLKNSLHCLVSRKEKIAVDLNASIDAWEELAITRMELTNSLRGF